MKADESARFLYIYVFVDTLDEKSLVLGLLVLKIYSH